MRQETKRLWLAVILCSVMGIVVGGTTSQAAISQCLNEDVLTNECLTQDPLTKQIEGMSMGLFVGAGAAIGATWRAWIKGE